LSSSVIAGRLRLVLLQEEDPMKTFALAFISVAALAWLSADAHGQ